MEPALRADGQQINSSSCRETKAASEIAANIRQIAAQQFSNQWPNQ
jgi:hypothetical protein